MAFSEVLKQGGSLTFTLRQIAEIVGGHVIGSDEVVITGIDALGEASEGDISFFSDARYRKALQSTKASALLVSRQTELYTGPQVVVSNPALSYARVAALFASPTPRFPAVSDKAFIHESSTLGKNVSVYPLAYVGEDAVIGDNVILFPGAFVGDRVEIGHDTVIYPNVTIMRDCRIGSEVIIHAGTVVGSDGFGFVRDGSVNVKIPQRGVVQIDDQVEIGANNTIDRAASGKTWIKRGVKTDNLVQIAHNVVIGEDTVIVAQAAIGGSVHVGRGVVIGAQVGIADHVTVEDGAMIGSQSGVAKSISRGEVVSGTPTMPHRLWLKTRGLITRFPEFAKRLRDLEKRMDEREKQGK
jgi:UDP-3-O-[3-hydroxymyristoyl] glucosamine N-acyltransferase